MIVFVLLNLLAIYGLTQLKLETSFDVFKTQDSEYISNMEVLEENFPSSDQIIVVTEYNDEIKGKLSDFSNARFSDNLKMTHCIFENTAFFKTVVFEGVSIFQSSKFKTDVFFGASVFKKGTDFSKVSVFGDLYCNQAIFDSNVTFNQIKILGHSIFDQAEFKSEIKLVNSFFNGTIRYEDAVLPNEFSFEQTIK